MRRSLEYPTVFRQLTCFPSVEGSGMQKISVESSIFQMIEQIGLIRKEAVGVDLCGQLTTYICPCHLLEVIFFIWEAYSISLLKLILLLSLCLVPSHAAWYFYTSVLYFTSVAPAFLLTFLLANVIARLLLISSTFTLSISATGFPFRCQNCLKRERDRDSFSFFRSVSKGE